MGDMVAFFCVQTGLVDGGADLSKKNGSHSYYQDVIIITIACHVLTLISRWFWLLWLSIPGFAAFQLYTHIVSPFVLSSKPSSVSQEEEVCFSSSPSPCTRDEVLNSCA